MTDFLTFINQYGMALLMVGQIALAIAFLYFKDKFAPKGVEKANEKEIDSLDRRVTVLETRMDNLPTADDLHRLEKQICDLRGDLHSVDTKLDGKNGLIERLELQVNRMDEFLLRAMK